MNKTLKYIELIKQNLSGDLFSSNKNGKTNLCVFKINYKVKFCK